MNRFAADRIVARAALAEDDAQLLRRMADWLDRNSLRIVWDNGCVGEALELHVSDDAVRYALTLAELRALLATMRCGQAVDWSRLRSVPRG